MAAIVGYLGTYESRESRGVYRFTVDLERGELSGLSLYLRAADAKYLSLKEGLLSGPVREKGRAGIFLIDTGRAGEEKPKAAARLIFQEETAPCFVTQDEERIYTANYHEGSVLIYRKKNGPALETRLETGRESGCHQVLLCGRYLLVFCLLLDRIYLYDRLAGWSLAGEIPFPDKTGPRHGILDRKQERLFVVSELSNEVFLLCAEKRGAGKMNFRLVFSCQIPDRRSEGKEPPASAAIRLSQDERFLYVSTRFSDVLSVFLVDGLSLSLVQQVGSGGKGPRDFVITEDGRYLLAANRTAGGLCMFRRDTQTGRIGKMCSSLSAPQAVSVVLE